MFQCPREPQFKQKSPSAREAALRPARIFPRRLRLRRPPPALKSQAAKTQMSSVSPQTPSRRILARKRTALLPGKTPPKSPPPAIVPVASSLPLPRRFFLLNRLYTTPRRRQKRRGKNCKLSKEHFALKRLAYIDWMRGLACLLMFQTHCYDSWLRPDLRDTQLYKWSQLGGTLPAPLFVFLAGLSFALVTERLREKGIARNAIGSQTIRRGAEIFGLGILFRIQEYALGYKWVPWTDLL